jgi:sugar fermentation stimulation protein A
MKLPGPLVSASFLSRPNRFLALVELEGQTLEAHLPDPGRLLELLVPGRRVWVRPVSSVKRKTGFTLAMVEALSGELVSLVTTLPNALVEEALQDQRIAELSDWHLVAREHRFGASRIDFLLGQEKDRRMLLEVKSVTLVENGRALFPDAITARGGRHVRELTAAVAAGWRASVLFVVQRRDATTVTAARQIDPGFAAALAEARAAGVRLLGYRCKVSLIEAHLSDPLPVLVE